MSRLASAITACSTANAGAGSSIRCCATRSTPTTEPAGAAPIATPPLIATRRPGSRLRRRPRSARRRNCRRRDLGRLVIGRSDYLHEFHVIRPVIEVVHDPRTLVDAVAGLNQRSDAVIVELGPAADHVDDMDIGGVDMKAGPAFGFGRRA